MNICSLSSRKINDYKQGEICGQHPINQKVQPEQSMHWTNITTIVGESILIVNRIKSLTVPCGSRLMLIFFLLVWPLLLLLPPRRGHGLFAGDGRLPNWLQLLRPSRLTWIAKREAVRLPSRLQFIDRLGRPGLRNAKLFGFPPGCLQFLGP